MTLTCTLETFDDGKKINAIHLKKQCVYLFLRVNLKENLLILKWLFETALFQEQG
jgi:hypothetical protein